MTDYDKPYLTYDKQLNLLISRGMIITDRATALSYLQRIGYYRLSGYCYSFRKPSKCNINSKLSGKNNARSDEFIEGTKFQDILNLYIFDKKLRLLLLDALERIEIAVRVDIAYLLGGKNQFAHTKKHFLHGNFTKKSISRNNHQTGYDSWLKKYRHAIARSKEDFVTHYRNKYGEPFPIWIAVEVWDFGLLSTFFKGMKINDKQIIANKYGLEQYKIMESWLRCLNYIRNVVAHHSRLWNRNLIDQPKIPLQSNIPIFNSLIERPKSTSRIYVVFCILTYLMQQVCPNSSWSERLVAFIKTFPQTNPISIKDMVSLALSSGPTFAFYFGPI